MSILEPKTIELGEGVLLDVDPKDEMMRIRIGDEKPAYVRKVDLWAVCFAIADPETQETLLPVRKTEMSTFIRNHRVQVKHDIKKGEFLIVHCNVSVPQTIEEGLAGTLMKKRSRSPILLPAKPV